MDKAALEVVLLPVPMAHHMVGKGALAEVLHKVDKEALLRVLSVRPREDPAVTEDSEQLPLPVRTAHPKVVKEALEVLLRTPMVHHKAVREGTEAKEDLVVVHLPAPTARHTVTKQVEHRPALMELLKEATEGHKGVALGVAPLLVLMVLRKARRGALAVPGEDRPITTCHRLREAEEDHLLRTVHPMPALEVDLRSEMEEEAQEVEVLHLLMGHLRAD